MGYYGYRKIRHDFEITKREVLFSIAIIAVMTLIGFVIHGKISDNLMNEYQKYNTALQIDNNSEMFSYGMRTDIGNDILDCLDYCNNCSSNRILLSG